MAIEMTVSEIFWAQVAREAEKNIPGIWDDPEVFELMRMEEPFCDVWDVMREWTPEVMEMFLDRYAEASMQMEEME